jgi:hypothetical protein
MIVGVEVAVQRGPHLGPAGEVAQEMSSYFRLRHKRSMKTLSRAATPPIHIDPDAALL